MSPRMTTHTWRREICLLTVAIGVAPDSIGQLTCQSKEHFESRETNWLSSWFFFKRCPLKNSTRPASVLTNL
jgi:hypothetical protein